MASTVTPEEIVTALGQTVLYPLDSEQFQVFAPFVGQLVEIVGKEHLDDPVGVSNLCDVTGRFCTYLASNEEFLKQLSDFERSVLEEVLPVLAEQLKASAEETEEMLAYLNVTEEQAMQMDGAPFSLSPAALELYQSGELTFAKLLTISPDVLIPKG